MALESNERASSENLESRRRVRQTDSPGAPPKATSTLRSRPFFRRGLDVAPLRAAGRKNADRDQILAAAPKTVPGAGRDVEEGARARRVVRVPEREVPAAANDGEVFPLSRVNRLLEPRARRHGESERLAPSGCPSRAANATRARWVPPPQESFGAADRSATSSDAFSGLAASLRRPRSIASVRVPSRDSTAIKTLALPPRTPSEKPAFGARRAFHGARTGAPGALLASPSP
jgi:hypothetical protein